LACFRLGAIAVPLGTRQREPELRYLLADCGASALVFEAEFASNLPPAEAIPRLRFRIAVAGAGAAAGCEAVAVFFGPRPTPPVPAARRGGTAGGPLAL